MQITQIFYEWTHRGEKGKNSLFAYTHTQSSFSLLFSLLFLFVAAIYFFYCFHLSWYSRILVLPKSSLYFSFSYPLYIYLNNCNRLAHTGRNMSLNQVLSCYVSFLLLLAILLLERSIVILFKWWAAKRKPLCLILCLTYARSIALSLDLKPCRTSRLLLVVNNNNNNNNNSINI